MATMTHRKLISRCSWQALVLACLSILVFPDTFYSSPMLGQTWLWLTATPVCSLLLVHRHRFAAAWSTALVASPSRRRRPSPVPQARRKGFGRPHLRQQPQQAA